MRADPSRCDSGSVRGDRQAGDLLAHLGAGVLPDPHEHRVQLDDVAAHGPAVLDDAADEV
jgi:hypothetical protein